MIFAARRLLAFALTLLAGAAQAQPVARELFVAVPRSAVDAAARLPASALTARVNADLLRSATVGSRVDLALSPTLRLTSTTRSVVDLDATHRIWRGEIPANASRSGMPRLPAGSATLVLRGTDVTGTVVAPGGDRYRIRPLGNGVNGIEKLDYATLPPEEPTSPPPRKPGRIASPEADEDAGADKGDSGWKGTDGSGLAGVDPSSPQIDLLVAYTPAARDAAGDIDSLIALAIDETNASFGNSKIRARVALAKRVQWNYSESGKDLDDILEDFADSDNIAKARNKANADVAVLLMNNNEACGKANDIGADESTPFVVVYWYCATGVYSFGHEIGHLMGARHDLVNDDGSTPYKFGHARRESSRGWRTIMGYKCSDGTCDTRIQYWSNPDVLYGDRLTGTPSVEDNAKVWNLRADAVSHFRDAPPTAVDTGRLYQMRQDGSILRWTQLACGANCPGWELIDNNSLSNALLANAIDLFQLHKTGQIWRYMDQPCKNGNCPGWQLLDRNPSTTTIIGSNTSLYQLHGATGRLWRYTGVPCGSQGCTGWELIDNNPQTFELASGSGKLYQLHKNGRVWRYTGVPCGSTGCSGWQLIDEGHNTGDITAGSMGLMYQIGHGGVMRYTGQPCSAGTCPGWEALDRASAVVELRASGSRLFERRANGTVWRYKGPPCTATACTGWEMIDNHSPVSLMGDGSKLGSNLYAIRGDRSIWRYKGTPCAGNTCDGWEKLDNSSQTKLLAGPRY